MKQYREVDIISHDDQDGKLDDFYQKSILRNQSIYEPKIPNLIDEIYIRRKFSINSED